ncbi:MAG: hypothetical protein ACXW3J_07350 [Methylocystis sp.]
MTIGRLAAAAGGNELVPMRWALWWKKPFNELPATINARAETVGAKTLLPHDEH